MHQFKKSALMCLTALLTFSISGLSNEKSKLEIPQGYNCENLTDTGMKAQCYEIQAGQKAPLVPDKIVVMRDCSTIPDLSERKICTARNLLIARDADRTVNRERYKRADSYERKAVKQIEKEAKNAKRNLEGLLQARSNANLNGCSWNDVGLNSRAVDFTGLLVMATIRITNSTPFVWDIESNDQNLGVMVKGLCPGGSITLAFSMRQWWGSDYVSIPISAIARPANGPSLTENFQISLYRGSIQSQRVTHLTWVLRQGRTF